MKVVEALDLAREALASAQPTLPGFALDVRTPVGRIVVRGTGADTIDLGTDGAWLAVDLGGDDHWNGCVGASAADRGLGVALDLAGDDGYVGTDRTQGAGVTGIGVLLDVAGSDVYSASGSLAQGAGQFGLGALIDLAGDDERAAAYQSQGAAFFGVGLLLDLAGGDAYRLFADGQGFGGASGVGVLADRSGDDTYEAIADAGQTKRPSYHSDKKISVSNAQGCSMGRRGDGADGHSWAGGLGVLLDGDGNDRYTAGNWAQGCGYWFGTGLLWDGAGNDRYEANGWASASGAHFCVGALVDEAGDDVHRVAQTWGPAFGHDFTVAILANLGGNDVYEVGGDGLGHSINRSIALFLDHGGDDRYAFVGKEPEKRRPGTAVFDKRFLDRTGHSRYWTEATSVGLFLDLDGKDEHSGVERNGTSWTDPPESDNARARNLGIGLDLEGGVLDLERPHRRHRAR
jgi:hypothetical protein